MRPGLVAVITETHHTCFAGHAATISHVQLEMCSGVITNSTNRRREKERLVDPKNLMQPGSLSSSRKESFLRGLVLIQFKVNFTRRRRG